MTFGAQSFEVGCTMSVRRLVAWRQLLAEVLLVDTLRPENPALHLALHLERTRHRYRLGDLGPLDAPRAGLDRGVILLLSELLLPLRSSLLDLLLQLLLIIPVAVVPLQVALAFPALNAPAAASPIGLQVGYPTPLAKLLLGGALAA